MHAKIEIKLIAHPVRAELATESRGSMRGNPPDRLEPTGLTGVVRPGGVVLIDVVLTVVRSGGASREADVQSRN